MIEGERQAARAAAEQLDRIHRMRLAALALHFSDQSTGGPKWSEQVIIQRTVVTELAVAARLSETDARRRVDTAEGLAGSFMGTRRLLEDGLISARHAEKIVQHGRSLPDECVPAYEARLLPLARNATVQRLDREARAAVEEAQPATALQRHRSAAEDRYLTLDPAADGMAYLTAFLPAVEAVAIYNRATELARALKSAGDPRTLAQLRIDALADLALNGETSIPGAPLGLRPSVRVTVPALTLLGHDDAGSAQLDGYGPIDRLTALELTRDAPSLFRVLTDPINGTVLTYGRERYTVPAALDDLVRTARAECTFPLSCRSAATADLDHTVAFSEGGETSFNNLSPLCSSHHKVKHHTEWRIEQHPGSGPTPGVITWTSPAGFCYTVEPTRLARPVPRFTGPPDSTIAAAGAAAATPSTSPAPF